MVFRHVTCAGSRFFQNVGSYLPNYMASNARTLSTEFKDITIKFINPLKPNNTVEAKCPSTQYQGRNISNFRLKLMTQ
jgi:hypothetical protein